MGRIPCGREFQIDVEGGGELRILDENAEADACAVDKTRAEGKVPCGAARARSRPYEIRVHDELRGCAVVGEDGLLGVAASP